jgi:hypothetical protein
MTAAANRVRLKTIAIPIEHGGWGFLFEPIVLGMLVAPTLAGLCLSIAAIAGFLSRHPLKIVIKNWGQRAGSIRWQVALWVAGAYGAIAVAAFAGAVVLAGFRPVVPLILLSPLIIAFLLYDTQNRARKVLPELAGPLGLAAVAPSVALADGWSWPDAWALWIILMARTIPSIFYVRARLRMERGANISPAPLAVLHLLFLAILIALVRTDHTPYLAVVALLVLAGRSAFGLSRYRRFTRARQIGFLEIGFGLVYVLVCVVGYWLGM